MIAPSISPTMRALRWGGRVRGFAGSGHVSPGRFALVCSARRDDRLRPFDRAVSDLRLIALSLASRSRRASLTFSVWRDLRYFWPPISARRYHVSLRVHVRFAHERVSVFVSGRCSRVAFFALIA